MIAARPRRSTGLTLIEVLVAVFIFGLMSVFAYGSLSRILDDRARLDAERLFWRDLSLTFVRLGDDLAHARARSIRDNGGFPRDAFLGQPTDTRPLGEATFEFTRGGEIEFTAARRSDLRRVAWRLHENRLERLTWRALDRPPVIEPVITSMVRDVEGFDAIFIAPDGSRHERWKPPVAGQAPPTLPRAVEIKLKLKDRGTYTRLFMVNE
jgi:general secretion pathway protein J